MQKKLTWYLLLLAAVLFAFILLFDRRLPSTAEQTEARRLFGEVDSSRVSALEITLNNGGVLRAEQTNGRWFLRRPVYPADQSSVENFITNVLALHRLDTIAPHEV